ncbi:MAG: glutaredoxin family protein [Planctomycetota bacterium]
MEAHVYTWSACRFCREAKELLRHHGVPFTEQSLDGDRALLRTLQARFEYRGVPLVLLDGDFVGGLAELRRLAEAGELDAD